MSGQRTLQLSLVTGPSHRADILTHVRRLLNPLPGISASVGVHEPTRPAGAREGGGQERPGLRARGPSAAVPRAAVLSAPRPSAKATHWQQEPRGVALAARGEGSRLPARATRRRGRLPIMGTSAMKTLRIELATLRDETQAA